MGSVTAFLTAFYSFRLLYLAFIQSPGATKPVAMAAHEPGPAMLLPMAGLSVGSIFSGYFFKDLFIGLGTCSFSGPILVSPSNAYEFGAEFAPYAFKSLPLFLSLTGTALALIVYSSFGSGISRFWLSSRSLLSLLGKKWYFDSFYNRAFVLPALLSGYRVFFRILDKGLIERLGPTGIGPVSFALAKATKSVQSGFLHNYVTLMVAFFVILVLI